MIIILQRCDCKMDIMDETKTKNAEMIVRYLAEEGNYGNKFTPYSVEKALKDSDPKLIEYYYNLGKIYIEIFQALKESKKL